MNQGIKEDYSSYALPSMASVRVKQNASVTVSYVWKVGGGTLQHNKSKLELSLKVKVGLDY